MNSRQPFRLNKRLQSFSHAFRGVVHVVRSQHNAWIHLAATVAVIGMAMAYDATPPEWCLLILCIGFVWTAEAFNTALERLVDLASPEYHPLAKQSKDIAAAAVLLSAVAVAVVGSIIFWPKIF